MNDALAYFIVCAGWVLMVCSTVCVGLWLITRALDFAIKQLNIYRLFIAFVWTVANPERRKSFLRWVETAYPKENRR